MRIFSNQLIYTPQSTPTEPPIPSEYEVYRINTDSTNYLGTITDLSKTFSCGDNCNESVNTYVYDGTWYYLNDSSQPVTRDNGTNIISATGGSKGSNSYSGAVVNSSNEVYATSGDSITTRVSTMGVMVSGSASSSSQFYTLLTNGKIWGYDGSGSFSVVTNITGWSKITGSKSGTTSSPSRFGYGLNEGKLYYLTPYSEGTIQIGTDTTWTDITGGYEGSNTYGYGINNGKLYALNSNPVTQVGSDTTWTKISGYSKVGSGMFAQPAYALGISAGKLYSLNGTTATQIGTSSDWKGCGGFYTNSARALAYDSTALYYITSSGATKLLDGRFVYCGGNYQTTGNTCAIAIKVKE